MNVTNLAGEILVGLVFGYTPTLAISFFRSRRRDDRFDFLGASALGVVAMSAVISLALIGMTNGSSVGIFVVAIQFIGFIPIAAIALPLAVASRRNTSEPAKWLEALGALVVCSITIYVFSGACSSGVCRYLLPGEVGGNAITDQYNTEPWITFHDTVGSFKIEYPPEMTVSEETYPPNSTASTSEKVVEFMMAFSDNQSLGTPPITLDVNHNPSGTIEAEEVHYCGEFEATTCAPYASPQAISIDGNSATLDFLTDGTFRYLSASLERPNGSVDFNVQLPFDAYDASKTLKSADDTTVQNIFTRMISTFEFTTSPQMTTGVPPTV